MKLLCIKIVMMIIFIVLQPLIYLSIQCVCVNLIHSETPPFPPLKYECLLYHQNLFETVQIFHTQHCLVASLP